jgi:hypothetical protein
VFRLTPADAADALVVLREVDQLEVVGEGADEHARLVDRAAGDERFQPIARLAVTATERFAERADLLFEIEGRVAGLGADHLAEQTTEQIDVVG